MKIEDIKVINLLYKIPNEKRMAYAGGSITGRLTTLVQVETNNRLFGLGSAYSHPELLRIVIEGHLRPLLLGEDPRDVESLWETMYQATRWYGRKGVAISAIGALDTAFWDLRGKDLEKPVYELLGGSRNKIPAYASALVWNDSLDSLFEEAGSYVDKGFRRVKMRLGKNEEYDISALETVRKAVGPKIDIIVDASMRYSLKVAKQLGKSFKEHNVFWYEEPFEPENIDDYVQLRKNCQVPLAAGENEFGVQGFREMLRAGALDIVQPDSCRAGGITECYRIGELANQHKCQTATHTWSDAVALTANMHVISALPNGLTVEVDRTGNPFIDNLLIEPFTIKDGLISLSPSPGLGITINESVVRQLTLPSTKSLPPGAYSDMSFGKEHWVFREPF